MASFNRIFFGVILATLICRGSCINCFYCNSANNSACLDLMQYDEESRARIVPIVNCESASPVAMEFFCRKIVQTIYHSNRDAEVRVTRGCGWVRHGSKDCYRADNSDHLEIACQCFTDQCNNADVSADPASSVLIFLVFSAVLYFYR